MDVIGFCTSCYSWSKFWQFISYSHSDSVRLIAHSKATSNTLAVFVSFVKCHNRILIEICWNLIFIEFPQGMGPATNGSGQTGMGAKVAPPTSPGQILCLLNAFGAKLIPWLDRTEFSLARVRQIKLGHCWPLLFGVLGKAECLSLPSKGNIT